MNATYPIVVAATVLLVASCAGRAPHPVSVSQAGDASMSCAAINSEIAQNDQKIDELGTDKGLKVAQNVGAFGLGIFTLGIGWALMDLQGAAWTDQDALKQRNAHLAVLAADQQCPETLDDPTETASTPTG